MQARTTRNPARSTPCESASVLEPFGTLLRKAERLEALHAARHPTLLPGPTGCGKTTLMRYCQLLWPRIF
jgi:MoxR-like ATPase